MAFLVSPAHLRAKGSPGICWEKGLRFGGGEAVIAHVFTLAGGRPAEWIESLHRMG
jgi:hypothetical protein